MKKSKTAFIAVLLCLAVSATNAANTIYVDAASHNDPGSGTFDDPFRQIQTGIDAAANGDTVLIQPGIYTGPGNRDLDPCGHSITIRSANPDNAEVVANTVINPEGAGRGFNIHSGEDANCVISGLTITNGRPPPSELSNGGGIYCYDNSPTIQNCVIKNGYAEGDGGGICCDYADVTIINCTIADNTADSFGGGISCITASAVITGCVITGNTANGEGGGIDSGEGNSLISNCVIFNNNAPAGGGINSFGNGNTNVVNCTIVANSADNKGGAIFCRGDRSHNQAIIENSVLWANSADNGKQICIDVNGTAFTAYSDIQGGQADVCVLDPSGLLTWGSGNINIDPCFASFDIASDPNTWDLHLRSTAGRWNTAFYKTDFNSDGIINFVDFGRLAEVWLQKGNLPEDLDHSGIVDRLDLGLFTQYFLADINEDGWITDAATSPCVDAGDPSSDWSLEPWPNGKRINMGAFGGTNQASKSGNIADLNIDGIVNFIDLAELGKLWGATGETIEDLDNNGTVDIGDLDIMAENWLWCKRCNIADFNIDGIVNFLDFAELGKIWGATGETIEDLDNSGTVDISDLDILAESWLWEQQ